MPTPAQIRNARSLQQNCLEAMRLLRTFDVSRNPIHYLVHESHDELVLVVQGRENVKRIDELVAAAVDDMNNNRPPKIGPAFGPWDEPS